MSRNSCCLPEVRLDANEGPCFEWQSFRMDNADQCWRSSFCGAALTWKKNAASLSGSILSHQANCIHDFAQFYLHDCLCIAPGSHFELISLGPKDWEVDKLNVKKNQTLFWNAATPRSSLLKGLNSNSLRRIYVTKIHTTLRTFHCKNTVHTDSYLTSFTSNGSFRGSFRVLNLDRCLESMDGRGCQLGPQRTFRWQAWFSPFCSYL